MEPSELFGFVVDCFERANVAYFVTGSMASITYGEPRLTNDIDIVAAIDEAQIADLKKCFPDEDFYFDAETAATAVRRQSQFNIIHPATGLKIDVMISRGDAFDRSRFQRVKRIGALSGRKVNFASPEDVILKKMAWYLEGGSEKHIRDIAGMIRVSGDIIDFEYIGSWAERLDVSGIWNDIRARMAKSAG